MTDQALKITETKVVPQPEHVRELAGGAHPFGMATVATLAMSLGACGGGGGSGGGPTSTPTPTPVLPTQAQAARFAHMAQFSVSDSDLSTPSPPKAMLRG